MVDLSVHKVHASSTDTHTSYLHFTITAIDFPNMFTENGYTREHAQNVEQMVDQIDRNNRNAVTADRNQKGFDNFVWKMIRNLGSITGPEMLKLGLVDHLATLDPLDGLLQSNQENKDKTGGGNNKEAMKQKWGNETDMDKFEATEQVTFSKYLSTLGKRKKMEERKHKMHSSLQKAADKSSAFAATLGLLGYSAPYYNLKKVRECIYSYRRLGALTF